MNFPRGGGPTQSNGSLRATSKHRKDSGGAKLPGNNSKAHAKPNKNKNYKFNNNKTNNANANSSVKPTKHNNNKNKNNQNNSKDVKKEASNITKSPATAIPATSFMITPETVHKDVLMLGSVNEVRRNEVIIDLPYGMKGTLREYAPYGQHFAAGQVLAVAVAGNPKETTSSAVGGATTMLPLTIKPAFLNRSLELTNMREGMFVSGEVSSVEDRGYTIAASITDTNCFIAKKDATNNSNSTMKVGQPVFCVVSSISQESKNIILSSVLHDQASAFQDLKGWNSVIFENVRPGNAAKAEVTQVYTNGVGARIYKNAVTNCFIPAEHLPGPPSKFSKGFRLNVRIIAVDYLSKSVTLTALPHVVTPLDTIIDSATDVVSLYHSLKGLSFTVPRRHHLRHPSSSSSRTTTSRTLDLPTNPPVPAWLSSSKEEKKGEDEDEASEPKEASHQVVVKVVGRDSLLGRLVVVEVQDQEQEQPFYDLTEIYPGMVVEGALQSVSAKGIEVKISPYMKNAKCGLFHLADTPVTNARSVFPNFDGGNTPNVDDDDESSSPAHPSLQCRVLYIDDDETVHLTNKPTLVTSTLRTITSYHHAIPGCVSHGWISKITKSEVTVSFYNHVAGQVPSADIEGDPAEVYHLGQAVVCQVVDCTIPSEGSTGKQSHTLQLTFDVQLARPVPEPTPPAKLKNIFQSINVGDLVSGVVSHIDKNGLTLVLESGLTGILPTPHLSDHHPNVCKWLMGKYYLGTMIKDMLVLNKDSSSFRLILSKKPSLCHPASNEVLPSTYDQLKTGEVIPGHVRQITDVNYTIGFLGTCKATAPLSSETTAAFVLGQSVRALVTDADPAKLTAEVDITLSESTATDGSRLLREYFSEIDALWARMKLAKMHQIGEVAEGKVVEIVNDHLVVQLSYGIKAFVNFADLPHRSKLISAYPQPGTFVRGVVIDVDFANAAVQLSLRSDLVDNIVDCTSVPDGAELFGTVLIVKPAYLVLAVTPSSNARSIVYAPACDYNCIGIERAPFYSYRPGMTLRVTKSASPSSPSSSSTTSSSTTSTSTSPAPKERPIFIVTTPTVLPAVFANGTKAKAPVEETDAASASDEEKGSEVEGEGEREGGEGEEGEEGEEVDEETEMMEALLEDEGDEYNGGDPFGGDMAEEYDEEREASSSMFQVKEDSDDEVDPDLDDLASYLRNQAIRDQRKKQIAERKARAKAKKLQAAATATTPATATTTATATSPSPSSSSSSSSTSKTTTATTKTTTKDSDATKRKKQDQGFTDKNNHVPKKKPKK